MIRFVYLTVMKYIFSLLLLLVLVPQGFAQRKSTKPKFDAKKNAEEQKELAAKAKATREDLIKATQQYKESLEKLLVPLLETEKILQEKITRKQQLIELGLAAKQEPEFLALESEAKETQEKITDTNKKMTQADQFIVEIVTLELTAREQAKRGSQAPGVYFDNTRYIRYTGIAHWSLRDYGKVENFFQANFRRGLPVSAFGQSDTHNRLGFDHSNSFDVALHPDTSEARTLMSYLRSQGIPFTAFRGAIPGNATGAHIHIGYPSHRFR